MGSGRGLLSVACLVTVGVGLLVAGYVAEAHQQRPPGGTGEVAVEVPEPGPGYAQVPALPPAGSAGSSGPALPDVPATGSGRFATAAGGSGVVGAGRVYRYVVLVEEGSGVGADGFAAAVERTLADPRGWTARRRWGFQRVSGGPSELTVHLATPGTTDLLCGRSGVRTNGEVSCRGGRNVVINLRRWQLAVPWFAGALEEYRQMVVNHEVGHFLGHGHVTCPAPGALAPVMQKQTLGLQGCARNPWPYPDGRTFVTGPVARQ
jgi:hypothetical protein